MSERDDRPADECGQWWGVVGLTAALLMLAIVALAAGLILGATLTPDQPPSPPPTGTTTPAE